MKAFDRFLKKWNEFQIKAQPTIKKTEKAIENFSDKTLATWNYLAKYKKMILAAPVAAIALGLAIINLIKLPALVGIDLQSNGEFSIEIIREVAVLCPLVVTALCLLLMFSSKRTLTPWMVSVFSLILPVLLLITNTFPS